VPQALLLVALFFAPLAFGAVHRPSIIVLGILLSVAGAWALRGPAATLPIPGRRWLVVLAGLVLLQLLPLPREVLRLVSPGSAAHSWPTISGVPWTTAAAGLVLVSWALGYAAAWSTLRGPWRQRAAVVVISAGAVATVAGLLQSAAGLTAIYGVWTPLHHWAVYGPYVNSHHFAGYLLLAAPLAAQEWARAVVRLRARHAGRRSRPWMAALEAEGMWALGLSALLVMFAAAFLDAASRGAVLAAGVGLVVFAAAHGFRRAAAGLGLAAVVAFAWVGPSAVARQVHTGRAEMWKDTLQLIPRHPVFGCGLEAFAEAYRPLQQVWRNDFVHHVHNEYLQAWIELGPGGLGALLALVLGAIRAAWQRGAAGAGLCAALCGVAAYNLVDFTWHIPANAVTWIVLAALATQPAPPDRKS
jgi:O-antigen ligase